MPEERPPIPQLPPIGWKDVACVGPMVLLGFYRWFSSALSAALIGHNPLLLSALRGSFTSMIVAGAFARLHLVPLWLAFIAPIPILISDDPFVYWAGRMYGRPLLDYLVAQSPSWRRQLPRAERAFSRFRVSAIILGNLPINPVPMITVVMFLAGETKMKFAFFLIIDVISLLIDTVFWVMLGYMIGDPAKNVAQSISHYALPITITTIGIIMVFVVISTRRSMKQMREQYGDDWYMRKDDRN